MFFSRQAGEPQPPDAEARPHSGFYWGTDPCYGFPGFICPRIGRLRWLRPAKTVTPAVALVILSEAKDL